MSRISAVSKPNTAQTMHYGVTRLDQPMTLEADWDAVVWQDVPALELCHYMGDRPAHFPRTQARLAYDDEAIYVIWRVEDQYVRAVAPHHQGEVWKDSCVEFFFTPGDDVDAGYFNLEMNCGGTFLFHYQQEPWKSVVDLPPAIVDGVQVAALLPRIVEPEIAEPIVWVVAYRLPIEGLATYYPALKRPAPGVSWRANFYKIADATSHPHYLTWSPVDKPKPDFHSPAFFGTITFE